MKIYTFGKFSVSITTPFLFFKNNHRRPSPGKFQRPKICFHFISSFHHHHFIISSSSSFHNEACQPASQLATSQNWRSIATRLVPTQLAPPFLSNLRSRAMGWWVGLDSFGPKGMGTPGGWVPARSLLTSLLAGCVLAGWLAGWLDSLRYRPPTPLV